MSERDGAIAGLVDECRRLSAATSGKGKRDTLPEPMRVALAGIDGALARFDAAMTQQSDTRGAVMADVAAMSASERDAAGNYV